jgi:hypothetical protein
VTPCCMFIVRARGRVGLMFTVCFDVEVNRVVRRGVQWRETCQLAPLAVYLIARSLDLLSRILGRRPDLNDLVGPCRTAMFATMTVTMSPSMLPLIMRLS